MTPVHHPPEAILADYASGALADGPSLAVSAHLERCASCRKAVGLFEAVGGHLVEEAAPIAMQPDALRRALGALERPAPAAPPSFRSPGPEGLVLPRALATRNIGRRRFVAPGFWIAPVASKTPDGWRTYLLRAPSGMGVPDHGHNGPEYTVVLRGAFSDDDGHFNVGDFAARDEEDAGHRPQAEGADPCICLITAEGGLKARGPFLGLLKPLLGI